MSEQLTPVEARARDAFMDLAEESVSTALSLITGLFVGLVEELARRSGHDVNLDIRIDGQGQRNITIHKKAGP